MFQFDQDLMSLSQTILTEMTSKNLTLALAESCTGGLISACLTAIPGSSSVVDRGFVTYSNESKAQVLMISPDVLLKNGAVSPEVANIMAYNARRLSRCSVGLSVTGIAGPGGGSKDKPVGLVYFGFSIEGQDVKTLKMEFGDKGREEIRAQSIFTALNFLSDSLSE